MADSKTKTYGTDVPSQPGGPSPVPKPCASEVRGSPRLGPAKPGGNSPRKVPMWGK